jgi:nucleotidyltransferase/DNA polymerase involved in DNA repair
MNERPTALVQEMGINTCGDLLAHSKEQLGQHFGKKVGETMWNYARGVDDRPLTTFKVRYVCS